jgi:hypothetical protein
MRLIVSIVLAAALLGCGGKSARTPEPPPTAAPPPADVLGPDFIDLEPGWRVRVVTPLLKSGGYLMKKTEAELSGKTVTIDTGGEFLGYETSFYSVKPRMGGGVRVKFLSAEVTREEETTTRKQPHLRLFHTPGKARFVRLIYLKRLTQSDHDMAVVAAKDRDSLESFTRTVQAAPDTACRSLGSNYCSWVPAGIAVRPERIRAGEEEWSPAR